MPAFLIPARNSRHRTACFALYKALLRQGAGVPLPDDLAHRSGPINPIKHLIRKGFRRNRSDTSPRLVVCALQNGYKFLDLLTAAQTTSSPEHSSILSFISSRFSAHRHGPRPGAGPKTPPPRKETRRPRTSAPHPDRVPVLTLVSPGSQQGQTHTPPVYASTARPLPLLQLSGGVRRVPVLDECNGIPFLRVGKPQSPALSRVLRQKSMKRQERTTKATLLLEAGRADARLEDDWERDVEGLLAAAAKTGRGDGGATARVSGSDRAATFGKSVSIGISHLHNSLNAERVDMIARGEALWKIVEQERALAKKGE